MGNFQAGIPQWPGYIHESIFGEIELGNYLAPRTHNGSITMGAHPGMNEQ
jgi:hypothetical protein